MKVISITGPDKVGDYTLKVEWLGFSWTKLWFVTRRGTLIGEGTVYHWESSGRHAGTGIDSLCYDAMWKHRRESQTA